MKKISLVFLLLSAFCVVGYTQNIKGTIFDKQTHNKISNALIYFNGTFVRTNSDKNGKFELSVSKFLTMPLTISASGYYSVTLTVVTPEKQVFIKLKPKENNLGQVVSVSKEDDKKRKENLRLFKNTFLGTTWNARNCKITNENDIVFISESDNDTLKAFSSRPILIDNSALGYKATYYLDEFVLCKKSDTFLLSGNISFDGDLYTDSAKNQVIELKRKQAYIGSRMYLFRSLWGNNLDSIKLRIKNSEDEFLNYDQIIYQKDSLIKYLKCPVRQDVNQTTILLPFYVVFNEADVYYDKDGNFDPSSVSIIYLEKDISFDKIGYFDPSFISWQGKLAKQRLGDLLPFEYSFRLP